MRLSSNMKSLQMKSPQTPIARPSNALGRTQTVHSANGPSTDIGYDPTHILA